MCRDGRLDWIHPDGKTPIMLECGNNKSVVPVPKRVCLIGILAQHSEEVSNNKTAVDLMEHDMEPILPEMCLNDDTLYHMNPSGWFVTCGSHSDMGLLGRKPIVDTYGGWALYGGGSLGGS